MAAPVEIPKRAFFKSAEVCAIAGVQPYVLKSWESEFPSLGGKKRRDGSRVYGRPEVELVLEIKELVYGEGLTLGAARRKLDSGDRDQTEPEAEGGCRGCARRRRPRNPGRREAGVERDSRPVVGQRKGLGAEAAAARNRHAGRSNGAGDNQRSVEGREGAGGRPRAR